MKGRSLIEVEHNKFLGVTDVIDSIQKNSCDRSGVVALILPGGLAKGYESIENGGYFH